MSQNNNPYQAAIERCQKQLKENHNLLQDANFSDPAMQQLVKEEIEQL